MRPNRRAIIFLKLPIIAVSAVIWLFGWTLICLGSKQKTVKTTISEKSKIAFTVIAPQQTCVMQSGVMTIFEQFWNKHTRIELS